MVIKLDLNYEDDGLAERLANPATFYDHMRNFGATAGAYVALRNLEAAQNDYRHKCNNS